MSIINVQKRTAFLVETDDSEQYMFTRYASDVWFITIGQADEPHYQCEEIEAMYQEYIKKIDIESA